MLTSTTNSTKKKSQYIIIITFYVILFVIIALGAALDLFLMQYSIDIMYYYSWSEFTIIINHKFIFMDRGTIQFLN